MSRFITFQRFNNEVLAHNLAIRLSESRITFEVEDNSSIFDPSFAKNSIQKEINVKIRPGDFDKVHEILAGIYEQQVNDVESNYYLFDFSDQELIEIVSKPDEWGAFDYQLAQKILKDRWLDIKPVVKLMKDQRLQHLSKPETPHKYWIYLGYVAAVLGGVFGLLIGWNLVAAQKTLPNGKRIYIYGNKERNHGNTILVISAFCLAGWLIYYFNS